MIKKIVVLLFMIVFLTFGIVPFVFGEESENIIRSNSNFVSNTINDYIISSDMSYIKDNGNLMYAERYSNSTRSSNFGSRGFIVEFEEKPLAVEYTELK